MVIVVLKTVCGCNFSRNIKIFGFINYICMAIAIASPISSICMQLSTTCRIVTKLQLGLQFKTFMAILASQAIRQGV